MKIIVLGPNQGAEAIETVAGGYAENPEQDSLSGPVLADDGAALVVMITVHAFFHALAAAPFLVMMNDFNIDYTYTLWIVKILLTGKNNFCFDNRTGNGMNDGRFDGGCREYHVPGPE